MCMYACVSTHINTCAYAYTYTFMCRGVCVQLHIFKVHYILYIIKYKILMNILYVFESYFNLTSIQIRFYLDESLGKTVFIWEYNIYFSLLEVYFSL